MQSLRLRPFIVAAALAALCVLPLRGTAAGEGPASVTIAYQPGLSYASLIVMKERHVLEKQFPNTKIEYKVLANGAAIRDGIISNQIQIGAGGVGPFLIGWDRGVGYKLIASLNLMDLWLMTKDPKIKSLKDVTPDMKIGMPSPDAIQGIVLRMAAQQQLGNAHALDGNILAIEHPLGMQSLSTGQLALHLTSPPFEWQEQQAGARVVLKSWDVAGKSTFNSVYSTDKFYAESPAFVKTFYADLLEATHFVKSQPKAAAVLLSHDAQGKIPPADFEKWLRRPDVIFVTTPHGFLKYGSFMKSIGLIKNAPASMREIELPVLGGVGD